MGRLKQKVLVLAVLGLLAGLTGCTTKAAGDKITVRIAYFPNITHSQALVGKAEGRFQRAFGERAEVRWLQFSAGSSEIEAVLAGAVDIGYIGPGPAIGGYLKSQGGIQIIAGATNGGAIFVSRKGLVIDSLQSLSGKKIAVPQFGNTQDLTLRHLLQENGLKDTTKGGTVDILQAENPDIKTYLDRGYVDAAIVPEPWGSRLLKEVNANLILDYNQILNKGNYPSAVVIVRKEFLRDHPDLVEAFLRTHVELTDYINHNLEQEKDVINRQLKEITGKSLDKDVLDSAFSRLIITTDPGEGAINDFGSFIAKAGYLKQEPDTSNLVNTEILDKILQEKG